MSQQPMDRCRCWGVTKIVISVEHCPSLKGQIGNELDGIVHFAMKKSHLNAFGKVQISAANYESLPTVGETNDLPSVPDEADARNLSAAE